MVGPTGDIGGLTVPACCDERAVKRRGLWLLYYFDVVALPVIGQESRGT